MGGGSGVSGKPIESAVPDPRGAMPALGTCCQGQVREAAQVTSQQLSCLLIFTRVTGVSVLTAEREKKRHIFPPTVVRTGHSEVVPRGAAWQEDQVLAYNRLGDDPGEHVGV